MEYEFTHKRNNVKTKLQLPIYYQLAVLFRTHNKTKVLCTVHSIAYRIAICTELVINDYLKLDGNLFKVSGNTNDAILKEVATSISLITNKNNSITPKLLVAILNGEVAKYSSFTIKKLKDKIYNKLKKDQVVIKKRKIFYISSKIVLVDNDLWFRLFQLILEEIKSKKLSLRTMIILICLNYINKGQDLLNHCNENDKINVNTAINTCINTIKEYNGTDKERLVYQFLKLLIIK
ncbi:hypothetical protein HERIO_411 [Hepatospora eriocheir]|uniref:Uncharacterized protein n=1 Tax=Hepatospora eriocheir TaxID=1081669 RepID=A0A1X0QD38_9MICR|nr:hypothetical protein HERIO_411 [Hepatospora eriocheir]